MAEARRWPPMGYYARIALTVMAVSAGVSVVLLAAWAVRNILVLILVAAVLAIGLDPAVRRLQKWRVPRGWAVAAIFLATLGFLILFFALVIPPLVREVTGLAKDIPTYIEKLRHSNGFFGDLQRKYDIAGKLEDLTRNLPKVAGSSFKTILGLTKSVGAVIFNLLTITILTIYFLMALPRTRTTAVRLFPPRRRERGGELMGESLERVGGYVSGNIAVSVIAGVCAWIALAIIGVPFAVALAMWVAIADLIPTVGATLGAVVAVIVAAFSSIPDAIATAIYFIVYQQVENYVIVPRVMKQAIDLSPAAVIIAVLIGGSLAGFAGALLALPVAAIIKVVIRELWLEDRIKAT
jgi:predicted PurR-regulated permease PerM